jgi:uncharacterized damage-inducible protein DinB
VPRRQKVIDDLFASMQATLAMFDGPRAAFGKSYAPGKWSLRELLTHLSDTETVMLDRLRRIACDEKPMLVAFDQDRWAQTLFYERRDMHLVKMQFQAARRSVIELASTLSEEYDAKVGIHTEAGPLTFAQILKKIADHNLHHLGQAQAAIEARPWPATK